jgi:hypothetical protein
MLLFCGLFVVVALGQGAGTIISVPAPTTLANGGEDPGCTLTRSPVACNERRALGIRCQWCVECNTCLWFCASCTFFEANINLPTVGVVIITPAPPVVVATTTTTATTTAIATTSPTTSPTTTPVQVPTATLGDKTRDAVTPAASPITSRSPGNAVAESSSTESLFTNTLPGEIDTGVLIGAIVGAVACLVVVVVVFAVVAYRRGKRNREISAIASVADDPAMFRASSTLPSFAGAGPTLANKSMSMSSFPSFAGAGLTVANKSFIGGPPNNLHMSFSSEEPVSGAYKCQQCDNLYPTAVDLGIHVQKRHSLQSTNSFGYGAGEFSTIRSTGTIAFPTTTTTTIRYDSSMPLNSTVEPANYRNLQPYSQQSEDRFAHFQAP